MIEEDMSNQDLMRMSNISANIITRLRTGKYISLEKVEGICTALHCTPNDILEFIAEKKSK
ncbi:helix-turn-helix domain-containing protein [Fannyhessea vaginae]|nr:helix-turn-helix transcriptional regulator [Fannyhessea vaginae]